MPKEAYTFVAADISALARFLAREIKARPEPPGHLDMLNLLARSGGYRNFQHFKARHADHGAEPVKAAIAGLDPVLRCFSADGLWTRWPSKASSQILCLWALWSAIPPRREFSEKEFNAFLKARHTFGDHALLRRSLFDLGLVSRERDGSAYRRIETKPPADAAALIQMLKRRTAV